MEEINNEVIEEPVEEIAPEKYYLLGIEVSIEELDFFMCEQAKGKQLFVENGKVIAKEVEVSKSYKLVEQINNLKSKLEGTDYIVLKIAETESDEEKQIIRTQYAKQLTQRKVWRDEINLLEEQLKQLTNP